LESQSEPKSHWTFPEVAILGADQKERGLWGRECYMPETKQKCEQTLESAQYRLEIIFNVDAGKFLTETTKFSKITGLYQMQIRKAKRAVL